MTPTFSGGGGRDMATREHRSPARGGVDRREALSDDEALSRASAETISETLEDIPAHVLAGVVKDTNDRESRSRRVMALVAERLRQRSSA